MLTVRNLKKSYKIGKETYEVLRGITFSVKKGEFIGIMGASGSGKTTLLNTISCYAPADSGSILLGTDELTAFSESELATIRNRKLGFVFQDFMLLDGLSVKDNILLPCIIANTISQKEQSEADKLCEVFGIDKIKNKYPAEISGGEKQRTAIARALISKPLLVLADEPTGNLDSKSARAVIDAFLEAKQTLDATIFMVTHDSFASSFCDRVIILKDGVVWKELCKDNSSRISFQDQLLDTIRAMGRDASE